MTPQLVVIVGPTASGKSRLALALARQLGGEILSADSMQVYQGMDVGTAKPSAAERQLAPHHGLDLVPPQIEFTVAMYRRYALAMLSAIRDRRHVPIMVGGTGLYVKAVLDGLCPAPPGDPAYRQSLIAAASAEGSEPLYAHLQQVDPATAARVHPHDTRRIIRALEVYRTSGRPLSRWHRQTAGLSAEWRIRQIGVAVPREMLYARIDARVRAMVSSGLVEEARRIYEMHPGKTASQALGYKQLFAAFEGRWSIDEAIEQTIRETRRYAKRQGTWFRADARIAWLAASGASSPDTLLAQVIPLLGH